MSNNIEFDVPDEYRGRVKEFFYEPNDPGEPEYWLGFTTGWREEDSLPDRATHWVHCYSVKECLEELENSLPCHCPECVAIEQAKTLAAKHGRALARMRAERDMSQKDVAREAGVSPSRVGDWEQGSRDPMNMGLETARRVAGAFGVSVDEFIARLNG